MDFKEPRGGTNPETKITREIMKYMKARGWLVKKTHGNQFQAGFPDLFAAHKTYGTRWIEVKTPTGKLSPSQIQSFTQFSKHGVPVYLMRGPEDYEKLFQPSDWQWGTLGLRSKNIHKRPLGYEPKRKHHP